MFVDTLRDDDKSLQGSSAKVRKEEHLQKCRLALNQYYGTDFFTREARPDDDSRERRKDACTNCPRADRAMHENEVRMVRSLYPPYWAPDPYPPRPRLTNPFKFTRRYGGCPNPRPWEAEHEQSHEDCRPAQANVGRLPDRPRFKPVHHKKPWDSDPEVKGEARCNLWHCKLGHKRSPDDRPW